MEFINVTKIRENEITSNLYSIDDFEQLLDSIERTGIVEPLIVRPKDDHFEIISGTRRFRAAVQLGLKEVPVIIREVHEINELMIVDHQQQRIKKHSEIIRELEIIKNSFKIKQGVRSDLNEEANKGREKLGQLKESHTSTKIARLTSISNLIMKLSKGDEKKIAEELKKLDSGSVSGTLKRLQEKAQDEENEEVVGDSYEIMTDGFKVYNKSSDNLEELEDGSIQLAVCSPPYFQKRDYSNGEGQIGQEESVDLFTTTIADHFDDCRRVLKDDGTLWVNLGDYIEGSGYAAAPEYFLVKMLAKGWILHDKIRWIKNNPVFTQGKRSVLADEIIYVFKKSNNVYYNPTWVNDYELKGVKIDYGLVKLRSVFDFRDNVVITNVANNGALKKACKKVGVSLSHSATFPISIPSIAVLTASKKGDTVLDLFNGTGTTGRSAKLFGRNYIGYDLNATYIKQTEVRKNMPIEDDLIFLKKAA